MCLDCWCPACPVHSSLSLSAKPLLVLLPPAGVEVCEASLGELVLRHLGQGRIRSHFLLLRLCLAPVSLAQESLRHRGLLLLLPLLLVLLWAPMSVPSL